MKIMICGSRDITNEHWTFNQIDFLLKELNISPSDVIIIEGAARGVDTIAAHWAKANNCPVEEYPADWNKYGKAAGYIRNDIMVRACDYCLILWDGSSKGTKHDIDLCKKYNKPNKVIIRNK